MRPKGIKCKCAACGLFIGLWSRNIDKTVGGQAARARVSGQAGPFQKPGMQHMTAVDDEAVEFQFGEIDQFVIGRLIRDVARQLAAVSFQLSGGVADLIGTAAGIKSFLAS